MKVTGQPVLTKSDLKGADRGDMSLNSPVKESGKGFKVAQAAVPNGIYRLPRYLVQEARSPQGCHQHACTPKKTILSIERGKRSRDCGIRKMHLWG